MPIVLDLVAAERLLLLKFLYKKGIPLTHKDSPFGNGLHVACAVTGSLSCVKFFVENNILTDIHEKCARDGHTPLTLAIYFKNHDILEYFKEKFGITCVSFEDVQVYFTRNETSSQ